MYKSKNKSGITLISLVIIVVVLLILAGITISNLAGENGLFSYAKKASSKYSINSAKEEIELAITDLRIEQEAKGENLNKEDLPRINNEKIDVRSTEKFPVTVINGKYKFNVDENFIVTYVGEADETIVTYITEPSSFTNKNEIKILVKMSNPKGIKSIQKPGENDPMLVEGKSNFEIDYTVTKNGIYTFKITDMQGKEVTKDIYIDLIDTLPPKDFTPEVKKAEYDITIIENGEDEEVTEESSKSGIDHYEYYLFDEKNNITKYDNNKIENLEPGKYKAYLIAYDKAGNKKQSNDVEFKISIQYEKLIAGGQHSFGIDKQGNLWAWGENDYGQLGDGTKTDRKYPVQIKSGTKFSQVLGTHWYSIAIDSEGNLWAWGWNEYGQLGNGTTTSSYVPVQIQKDTKFRQTTINSSHNLEIDSEGNLWACGHNNRWTIRRWNNN